MGVSKRGNRSVEMMAAVSGVKLLCTKVGREWKGGKGLEEIGAGGCGI